MNTFYTEFKDEKPPEGVCPVCGKIYQTRERHPWGFDTCPMGHSWRIVPQSVGKKGEDGRIHLVGYKWAYEIKDDPFAPNKIKPISR